MKAIARFVGGNVDGVLVVAVDQGQRLNEIDGVAFVTAELRPNGMSVDCDPHQKT